MTTKKISLQDRLLITVLRWVGHLPLAVSTRLGAALAGLVSWAPLPWAGAFRTTIVNLMLCYPELTYKEAAKLARRSLRETGGSLMEFAHVWTQPAEKSLARITQVSGLEALRAELWEKRPVLLLTLHQSSWELPNLFLGKETAMTVFYQKHKNTALNRLVTNAREGTGSKLVPANSHGIRASLAAMKRNEAVAILADHTPHTGNNPQALFYGHPLRTSTLPYKLIQRFQPAVFFVSCYRGEGGVNDVRMCIEPAPEDIYSNEEAVSLAAMNDMLETIINRHPEQYHWTYKRFRRINEALYYVYKREVTPLLREARKKSKALTVADIASLGTRE